MEIIALSLFPVPLLARQVLLVSRPPALCRPRMLKQHIMYVECVSGCALPLPRKGWWWVTRVCSGHHEKPVSKEHRVEAGMEGEVPGCLVLRQVLPLRS